MTYNETINGTQVKVIGSIGICGGEETYEVRTWIDGKLEYYEEASSKKQMLKWCEKLIKQCTKELAY
jgi:hypothetical protein